MNRVRGFSGLLVACVCLAACTPDGAPPPTPTKTPGPPPTAAVSFPSVDTLAEVALRQADVGDAFEVDAEFNGPLTRDLLAQASSPQTAAFVGDVDEVYGYRSAYIRAESVDDLTAVRCWLVVFTSADAAREFARLHPTLVADQQDFTPIDFPAFGEESAAYRATSTESGVVPLDRHDLVFRRRNVVAVLFMVTASGLADLDAFEGYAAAIDGRLRALGSDN